jgi:hypothetical protein
MNKIERGNWQVRSVCTGCGYNAEIAPFGNAWFTNSSIPVCPKCGEYEPFEAVRMRNIRTFIEGEGFLGKLFGGRWEESWETHYNQERDE